MKTTIDLPPELVREMKLRAVHEGRKLKDVAAELLRHGLVRPELPARRAQKPRIIRDPVSGLPVIHPRRSAGFVPPTLEESLALIEQANQQEDLRRAGLAD
ncbi:MAG: hypothetical protein K9M97_03135 [Akkermansiaceae bacterium]|nr:hypothetical protein [Akkermansiaceae bacterium]